MFIEDGTIEDIGMTNKMVPYNNNRLYDIDLTRTTSPFIEIEDGGNPCDALTYDEVDDKNVNVHNDTHSDSSELTTAISL
ncbi:hypothetical protein Nepgr_016500 [Nepenthes gracilis]|uniref:Uncharacterized protein n=1 Tax=Nepenthes gracilis TaxID=150966 RepID=A0AAD3SPT9_NEPGR|nr:hypothetical protein Nepgr_016500 [Nepenthes gracilis]